MRAPRLIVLAVLAALGTTVLVAPSPASAVTRTLRTTYLCEVNGNSAHVKARIRVDLPRQLHRGDRMHARRLNVRLVLPANIVDYMRALGGRSVEGTSYDAFYRVESHQRQIKRLRVPDTDIPSSGPMVPRRTATSSSTARSSARRRSQRRRSRADVTPCRWWRARRCSPSSFPAAASASCATTQRATGRSRPIRLGRGHDVLHVR